MGCCVCHVSETYDRLDENHTDEAVSNSRREQYIYVYVYTHIHSVPSDGSGGGDGVKLFT